MLGMLEEQTRVAVRIGLPAFDGKCEALEKTIEMLNLSPLHSIASDLFVERLSVLIDAVEGFFKHEEELLDFYAMPEETKRTHGTEHNRIRKMLNDIYRNGPG